MMGIGEDRDMDRKWDKILIIIMKIHLNFMMILSKSKTPPLERYIEFDKRKSHSYTNVPQHGRM